MNSSGVCCWKNNVSELVGISCSSFDICSAWFLAFRVVYPSCCFCCSWYVFLVVVEHPVMVSIPASTIIVSIVRPILSW